MKKLVFSMTPALLMAACLAAGADHINVRVNGETVQFDGAQPQEIRGRIMVPLRGVLETMGATVHWTSHNSTVTATRGNMELSLPLGSRTAMVNDHPVQLDVPAMTLDGHTMVPLRFVSEALGADVVWLSGTRTAMIDTSNMETFRAHRSTRREDRDENSSTTRRTVLESGTVIPMRLETHLNSRENDPGDKFTATVLSGRDDAGLPEGTKIEGVVREVIAAKSGKPGVLDVDFQRFIFPDGSRQSVSAALASLDSKSITRNSAGRLEARAGKGDERLKWVGIGAGAGLLIGTVTKGNALINSLLGAGAGFLYNELQRKGANDVDLKAGTEIGVRLDERIAINGRPVNERTR